MRRRKAQPGPCWRLPLAVLLGAGALLSWCLPGHAFYAGGWEAGAWGAARTCPARAVMKAQSVAQDASVLSGFAMSARPPPPPSVAPLPPSPPAATASHKAAAKVVQAELQASRESRWIKDLERIQGSKDRGALRTLLRSVDPLLLTGGSMVVCEHLVLAAASCHEYELLSEAMEALLHKAQAPGGKGWRPMWSTFSTVLIAYRKAKDLNRLLRFFKAALQFNGFSKTVLLNIVLAALCENGQGATATYYIQVAREKWGIVPNEISWNTLLGWAARSGKPRLVADLEERMREEGIEGDVFTNNIRLQYLLAHRPEEGVALFHELKTRRMEEQQQRRYGIGGAADGRASGGSSSGSRGSSMDPVTVNIMTDYVAKTRGVDEAMSLVSEMERSLGLKPEAVTHNILLDALIKSAQLDRAVDYFGQITTAAGLPAVDLTSTSSPFTTALQLRSSSSTPAGPGPRCPSIDSTTFDIVLSGLVQSGRISAASSVHNLMQWARLKPTIYTFASLVRLQKTATDVYRIWAQARSSCPRLTVPFLNILIHELGQTHNDLLGACCAFTAIRALRMSPTIVSYNSLVAALVRDDHNLTALVDLPRAVPDQVFYGGIGKGGRGSNNGNKRANAGSPASPALDLDELFMSLEGSTRLEAALKVVRSLYEPSSQVRPNARTFTILMAGITRAADLGSSKGKTTLCLALYKEALSQGVAANGLLCHTLIRGFGPDAVGALAFFKKELRAQLKAEDSRVEAMLLSGQAAYGSGADDDEDDEEDDEQEVEQERERPALRAGSEGSQGVGETVGVFGDEELPVGREEEGAGANSSSLGVEAYDRHSNNLLLGYRALLHVCGVGGRPDLALQVFYAMVRDQLAPGIRAWDTYVAGKESQSSPPSSSIILMKPYESLLRNEAAAWADAETKWKRIRLRF